MVHMQVDDAQRRARLVARHALGPSRRLPGAEPATRALTCLHATDNASVYLTLHARSELSVDDVHAALYRDRTVVKQMAMRRTIFGLPRDLLPAAWGAPGARVARQERRRTIKELRQSGGADAEEYLRRAEEAVPAALAGRELTAAELRGELPELDRKIHVAPGTKWGGETPLMPRLLTILSAAGRVVRAGNVGHWRQSRPRWTATSSWLAGEPPALPENEGYAELVRRWLRTFGPGTETDLVWWLGSTRSAVRRALADVEAVPVGLSGDRTGWLLPDDLDPVPETAPEAALLPVLDPTTMGWKERDFYLGDHGRWLFDSAGNGGNTAWWGGRIVGGWVQDAHDGRVRVEALEQLPPEATHRLELEAERLTAWLGEVRLSTFFPSPQMLQATELAAGAPARPGSARTSTRMGSR